MNGIGTEVDKVKGFESYNKAIGIKEIDAQNNIKTLYKDDDKIINELDVVNYWYHKAAENDNKVALYKLGELYEIGKGVCENLIRAFEFYKQSADQGYLEAQCKVRYYYDHGIMVDVNKERSKENTRNSLTH
ncbi:18422_t:CDS:1 [Funneliformis geosporum]|nr:18422_t:CDS:1 [Funneliformis geosporum]